MTKKTTNKTKSRVCTFWLIIALIIANGMVCPNVSHAKSYRTYGTPSSSSFKSYMSYRAITDKSSKQYKLQKKAKTNSKGIRTVNGRYCIAMGSYYATKIGTKIDLVMKNGKTIKCILADQKADKDTDSAHRYTSDGSIVEFIVDTGRLPRTVKLMGDVSYAYKSMRGNIKAVRVYK